MRIRYIITLLFMGMMFACSCAHTKRDGADARSLAESVVYIDQRCYGDRFTKHADGGVEMILDGGYGGVVGTGVVIEVSGGESLVAAVVHVTHKKDLVSDVEDEDTSLVRVSSSILTIRTLDGTQCAAEEIYFDEVQDLSFLKVKCIAGVPLELATELPPIGAEVLVTGAALGIHPDGIFIPVDGRYVGNIDKQNMGHSITAPVAAGHSGAPVVYEGRIIGIVKAHQTNWEHLSFFVPVDVVRNGAQIARKTWHAK